MAWPKAPEPFHAFSLTLFQQWPKGTPKEERPKPFFARLYHLTDEQFAWIAETVAIEAKRRPLRKAPDLAEVPA